MDAIGQMTAVAGVLALLGITLWWVRRRGPAGNPAGRIGSRRRMESVERLALGPQHTLHLVRLGEIELLVASSPAGCSLVQGFPAGGVELGAERTQ